MSRSAPATKRKSEYYGVSQKGPMWRACYRDAGSNKKHIGTFENEEEAARAYDAKIKKLGLQSRRKMNEDAQGRLVAKPGRA
mmetsp:Transcript_18688/g.58418  ORF Transcript_18688/g.58418 Transcript_18688/m.58418 type:complete len:82 (+) Transcript_18688:469-714(+)